MERSPAAEPSRVDRVIAWFRGHVATHWLGRALLLLVDNLDAHQAPTAASAMAFDAFLSLVPLVAMGGYLLHRLRSNYELLAEPIFGAAPGPVKQLVDAEFLRLSEAGAAVVAPVSVAAFLWVSSAGISTAMGVFETMFHSAPRPWIVRRIVAIGCVIVGFVLMVAVLSSAIFVGTLSGSYGAKLVAVVVPLLFVVGMICAFFRIAIRGPRPRQRRLVPGALVTLVLWAITSAVFSFYVATLSRYATLYGGLAAVAIFLFWLWLLALSLLVGGEVNAQLEGIRESAPPSLRAEWTFVHSLPRKGPPTAPPPPMSADEPEVDEVDEEPGREARAPDPSHAG